MRVIFARLSCVYTGRIDANLSLGDYLLLLRDPRDGDDGSVLVYSTQKGLGARNWMPPGSDIEETDSGYTVTHRARGERLDIFIDTVHAEFDAFADLEGELIKMGAEREVSDLLAERTHLLGPGLELVGREARTPAGPIDLLCRQRATGQPVLVEVKRNRIALADYYQLLRYKDALPQMPEWQDAPAPRCLLVAPVLAKPAKALIDVTPDCDFVRLGYTDVCAAVTDEEHYRDLAARAVQSGLKPVKGTPKAP